LDASQTAEIRENIMIMKRWTVLIALLVACRSADAGTNTVYDFLRFDVSSRAAAMAGSFGAVLNDPNSIFYNPAALGSIETPKGSIGFFKHLLDINVGYVSYSQPLGEDVGWFGTGAIYSNYGSFDETDELGNVLGTFSASDFAFVAGYANELERNFYYGVNVKFIYSSIAGYKSTALAGDIGLFYNIPGSRITLGVSVRNAGIQLSSYLDTKEDLPLDVLIGGSIVPKGLPLLLNVTLHKLNENTDAFGDRFRAFSVGGEFTLSKVLRARFGYNNEQRKDLKIGTSSGLAGFSGGIGITVHEYEVDYSLSSLGKVGNLHRISLTTTL
jgi:hypothetical protein